VLRLLASGPTGPLLLTLGERPLRTKGLTRRLPVYSPRTIYRCAGRLTELHLLERREEPGVPSKVTHSLTAPFGQELRALVRTFAFASTAQRPDGGIDRELWSRLGQIADLWDSGIAKELSFGPRSATELAMAANGLTYHQVERRLHLLSAGGLLGERAVAARGRRYELSGSGRRAMALVAGAGRWRRRYVGPRAGAGLTATEMATVLRVALPLVQLPQHTGRSVALGVVGEDEGRNGDGAEDTVWAVVREDGALRLTEPGAGSPDGWAAGRMKTWLLALLDGKRGRMRAGGDLEFVNAALIRLHAELWPHGRRGSGSGI
jgi:DNA-binding HxlR family transcriptional regulator